MFQLKRSLVDPNPTNLDPNTALPNMYGKIRTLKKDFEDFKTGKSDEMPDQPVEKALNNEPQQVSRPADLKHEIHPVQSFAAPSENHPQPEKITPVSPTPKSIPPFEAALPQRQNLFPPKEIKTNAEAPNPLGSENFFQEQPAFENVGEELNKKVKESSSKPSRRLTTFLAIFLLLIMAGGGFYYWWFYLKSQKTVAPANNPAKPSTKVATSTTTPSQTSSISGQTAQTKNNKFNQWTIDLSSDKIAAKLAIKRYISDFITSASENDIVESKLVSSDNQPIAPGKFQELFDFNLPSSVSSKLTEEYSIFVKKENGQSRMGAAFKLSQTTGLSESLRSEESSIISGLKSFYLDAALPDVSPVFNSSKYKSADIRYFNFPSISNTSLDYTVISGGENNYFIFATSKETIRSILDYMSGK